MKIIILAGGGGTRLWPFSREHSPKQVLPMLGRATLLQQTYKRLRLAFPARDILVVTGKKYGSEIRKQLPSLPAHNLLLEPTRRESAGAIGLAAALIGAVDEKEIIISVHSDHWVSNPQAYVKTLQSAAQAARRHPEQTVIVGVKPAYPETGYGYIQVDKKVVQGLSAAYRVKSFKEKPSLPAAKKFLRDSGYLWNVGWFAWRVDHLLALYKKYLPEDFKVLRRIAQAPKKELQSVIDKEFPKLQSSSIDKSIIEKTRQRLVLKIDMPWADIGHWRSVYEISAKDKNDNVVFGASLLMDSHRNLFWTEKNKAVASLGVNNLILIDTPDIIFVADKSEAQNVKGLVAELKRGRGFKKYL